MDPADYSWDAFSASRLVQPTQAARKLEAIGKVTNFLCYWLHRQSSEHDFMRNSVMALFGFLQDQASGPRSLVLSWLARSSEKLAR